MDLLPVEFRDLSLLRRLLFAVTYLPKDLPQYWFVVEKFVSQGKVNSFKPEQCRLVAEKLKLLDEGAFVTEKQLIGEIHQLHTMTERSCTP